MYAADHPPAEGAVVHIEPLPFLLVARSRSSRHAETMFLLGDAAAGAFSSPCVSLSELGKMPNFNAIYSKGDECLENCPWPRSSS